MNLHGFFAWEAGELCSPRTIAGGFGNPSRVPEGDLPTHSGACGRNWVGNRLTSIVNFTVKSLKSPSSRLPMPPEVSHVRCEITDDPQGSARPRLRPFASALQASAPSRLHLPFGPGQRTSSTSYHQGP